MEKRDLDHELSKMFTLAAERQQRFDKTDPHLDESDTIACLSKLLHPKQLDLEISEIIDETSNARTYKMIIPGGTGSLPCFRAGQYISIKPVIEGVRITRPFSIASPPSQADNYYEITVAFREEGFFSSYARKNWEKGSKVIADGPHGNFYYEPLRDHKKLILLAGGSGITPFRSMILDCLDSYPELKIILIYGSKNESEIIYDEELHKLSAANERRLKIINVISEPSGLWQGLKGMISGELIKDQTGNPEEFTFFICGPAAMHYHCLKELRKLEIPDRQIRREMTATPGSIKELVEYEGDVRQKEVRVSFSFRNKKGTIKASTTETLLTAFERAGLEPESRCRSGECGFCRALLISGDLYMRKEGDKRRAADLEYGFIHPCSTYPLSDLEVEII